MSKKNKNINEEAKVEKEVKAEEAPKAEEEKAEKGLEERIAELQKENEELKANVAKEKDDYIRLMADFENFRRHSAEAKLELVSSASAETIKGLLPILDDCERAMKMLSDADDKVALEGTELIYSKLMNILTQKGLSPIEAKGSKFDENLHEAVTQFPAADESQKGMVVDVVEKGYYLNSKVLRYAKVVVAV